MEKFRFLKEEEIFGENKLDMLKNDERMGVATDLTVVLGGDVHTFGDSKDTSYLQRRQGSYWTQSESSHFAGGKFAMDKNLGAAHMLASANDDSIGVRPVLEYDSDVLTNEDSTEERRNGVRIVEYGYYPQQAPAKDVQDDLESQYKNGKMVKTGKTYTFNIPSGEIRYATVVERGVIYHNPTKPFIPVTYEEYEYNGHRYIRMETSSKEILSNEERYKRGDGVWIEVSPVRWLVDEEKKIMVAEKVLFAGIEFDRSHEKYQEQNFQDTDIAKFMKEYFLEDLTQTQERAKSVKNHYSTEELVEILEKEWGHKIEDCRVDRPNPQTETQNEMLVDESKLGQIYSKARGRIKDVIAKIKSFFKVKSNDRNDKTNDETVK